MVVGGVESSFSEKLLSSKQAFQKPKPTLVPTLYIAVPSFIKSLICPRGCAVNSTIHIPYTVCVLCISAALLLYSAGSKDDFQYIQTIVAIFGGLLK